MSRIGDVLYAIGPIVALLWGVGGPIIGYLTYRGAKKRAQQARHALRIGVYYTLCFESLATIGLLEWIGRITGLHIVQAVFVLTLVPLLVASLTAASHAGKLQNLNDTTDAPSRYPTK